MIGHIESYDNERQQGVIKCENKLYKFHLNEWTSKEKPKLGDEVDFILEDDKSLTNIGLLAPHLKNMEPVKNRRVAAILGVLFGAIGLHRLYLGFYGIAIAQITLTYLTGGFGLMWGFIEGVLIFGGQIYKDAKGRHLK
jgi:TM2 domain-containing membrane protein YozV